MKALLQPIWRRYKSYRQERGKESRWESRWRRPNYSPPWIDRGVLMEIVEAVETGFLPSSGHALDIGCGLGDVAAWFAGRGYRATGVDVAPSAIKKARARHADLPVGPEFRAIDICTDRPPGGPFNILIDVGCLHQIPAADVPAYARSLRSCASTRARMLLYIKAFRSERPFDDADEKQELINWISDVFNGFMTVETAIATYVDKEQGRNPENALPGMFFRLIAEP